jgi:hypothetical protein
VGLDHSRIAIQPNRCKLGLILCACACSLVFLPCVVLDRLTTWRFRIILWRLLENGAPCANEVSSTAPVDRLMEASHKQYMACTSLTTCEFSRTIGNTCTKEMRAGLQTCSTATFQRKCSHSCRRLECIRSSILPVSHCLLLVPLLAI